MDLSIEAEERTAVDELPPPTAETVAKRYASVLKPRDLRSLHRWLNSVIPGAPLDESVAALEAGARWLRGGAALSRVEPAPIARLRVLAELLEDVPAWRRALAECVATVLREMELLPALESGLPNDRGIGPESADRLARRFLPTPNADRDLGELLSRLFPTGADAEWLSAVPNELACRLQDVLVDGATRTFAPMEQALLDSVALVAARTSALGLSREIRARAPDVALAASPFFLLPRLCDALFTGIGSAASCRDQIAACHDALGSVLQHLEEFGVSVDVVYRIEVIGKNLGRLADLLGLLEARAKPERAPRALQLLSRLVAARVRDRSLRDILSTNLHLLARKVIEHAGETGEHYITTTGGEWWKMMASAGGGGMLTAGTAALKFFIYWGHFPLFVEGAFASANYAASFLLMQLCGFTLATKQPSMIAAALAGALRGSEKDPQLDPLVTQIARICRSQLAAAIGNVGLVIPAAIGLHLLWVRMTGHGFLDANTAEHTIASLNPLRSGTIFFAALTGVLLWLSSLGAGWLENWSTYRRIPDGIAHHPAGQVVGRRVLRWLARRVQHGVAGVGGNITIGVLLGMTPVFGKFFGLPLEVRHVTLSTGSLALSLCSLGVEAFRGPGVVAAIAGIVVILALNFGVSFTLALAVALRARTIDHAGRRLLQAVFLRFRRRPLEFILPLEREPDAP
jgi:site-specific recombinase